MVDMIYRIFDISAQFSTMGNTRNTELLRVKRNEKGSMNAAPGKE